MVPNFIQILRSSERVTTPWKNGGGTTTEIAIEPSNASLAENNFLWRLSSAELKNAGSFSLFPSYNRYLTLIEGKECILHINEKEEFACLHKGEIFHFSGDSRVVCELPAGHCKDVGLIYQKDKVNAGMNLISINTKPRSFTMKSEAAIFFLISGDVQASIYPGEYKYTLHKYDAVHLKQQSEGAEQLILLEPKTDHVELVAVELRW